MCVHAQTKECGTKISQEQLDYYYRTRESRRQLADQLKQERSISYFYAPVQFHVVRENDGSGGLTEADLITILNDLNTNFLDAKIQFFQCGQPEWINSSANYNFDSDNEESFCSDHDVANVINIYCFNSVIDDGTSVCGYSRNPPSVDRAIFKNSCVTGGNTTHIHEIGHYFSLFHTFGKGNDCTFWHPCNEKVDGSNCNTAGDDICDTPADPGVNTTSGCGSESNCLYSGSCTDGNGDTYSPPITNFMSYSSSSCRTNFTNDQDDVMHASALSDRDYLSCPLLSSCASTLSLSGTQNSEYYYQASDEITSTSIITSGVYSSYHAGNSVMLEIGFNASEGSHFHASIDGCWGTDIFRQSNDQSHHISIPNSELVVRPNPFLETFEVAIELNQGAIVSIDLYNVFGQHILTIQDGASKEEGLVNYSVNASTLPAGVYMIHVVINGKAFEKRIVKID